MGKLLIDALPRSNLAGFVAARESDSHLLACYLCVLIGGCSLA